jgi:hypothetical protein
MFHRWGVTRTSLLLAAVVMSAAACSGSVSFSFGSSHNAAEAAVKIIEGEDMQTLLGLGPINGGVCQEPLNTDVGTTFDCEAFVDAGALEFEVEIMEEERIFARPQNVVTQDALADIERSAANALTETNGEPVPADSLDCGDAAVLVSKPLLLACDFVDPNNGDIYDAEIDIPDIDDGAFTVRIADAPRS